jgi:hypothetical protein
MTPGNDARDPIDDWLDSEVQPLPPPAGAFEAVSRRARNRKMGRLAMAASSAAAVAVAVVLAVPALLAPHGATPVAAGSQPPGPRTVTPAQLKSPATPAGSASPRVSPPSTTSAPLRDSSAPAGGYPGGGPVPANFQPTSVTFIGTDLGWAIGQAGTPGTCANANPSICTSLAFTQDGARTWRGVPAPSTDGVSGIRFYNGQDGWAYGPELWSTKDYGNTWHQVNTGGLMVTDLETVGGQAFAVFAQCASPSTATSGLSYFSGSESCSKFSLESSPAGSDSWAPVTLAGTGQQPVTMLAEGGTGTGVATLPTIVLQGGTGWFVGPRGQVFTGSLSSATWTQASVSPCTAGTSPVVTGALLDWSLAGGELIMACDGQQSTVIYASGDGATSWIKQATAPGFGLAESLTASPAAPCILATTDGIEVLSSGTRQWRHAVSLQGGFTYVGMTSDGQGVAVPASTSLHEVWMTYDGGLTWTPSAILP